MLCGVAHRKRYNDKLSCTLLTKGNMYASTTKQIEKVVPRRKKVCYIALDILYEIFYS